MHTGKQGGQRDGKGILPGRWAHRKGAEQRSRRRPQPALLSRHHHPATRRGSATPHLPRPPPAAPTPSPAPYHGSPPPPIPLPRPNKDQPSPHPPRTSGSPQRAPRTPPAASTPPPPPPSSRPLLSPPTAAAATAAVGGDGCRPASDTPTRQTARGPPTGWGGAPPPPTSAAWGARPTHPLPRPRAPARTQRACAARGCRLAGPPAPPASRPVRAPARSPPRQAPAQSLPPPVTGQARRPGGRGHGEGGEGEEAGEGGSPTARRRLPDPAPTVPAAGPWATPRRPPHAARSGEQRPHAHREKVMMVWKRPTRVRGRRT